MEGENLKFAEAIIDNGTFGKHVVRFEAGVLAQQADGAAAVYLDGDTMLLSATAAQKSPRESIDFFPLTVDVEEDVRRRTHPRFVLPPRGPSQRERDPGLPPDRSAAASGLRQGSAQRGRGRGDRAGTQPAGRVRRGGDQCRIHVHQIAGLPFHGPIGAVRVALIDEQWVCFPTVEQEQGATFSMVVAGRVLADGDVAIMMVEAGGTEATWNLVRSGKTAPTEDVVAGGLEAAKPFIKVLCDAQAELAQQIDKETYPYPVFKEYEDDVYEQVLVLGGEEPIASNRSPTSSIVRLLRRTSSIRSSIR